MEIDYKEGDVIELTTDSYNITIACNLANNLPPNVLTYVNRKIMMIFAL